MYKFDTLSLCERLLLAKLQARYSKSWGQNLTVHHETFKYKNQIHFKNKCLWEM